VYQYLDAAVVRAPAWQPGPESVPWPELTGPDATRSSWRVWLGVVWQIPGFSGAVEAASPDLACRVDQIRSGQDVPEPAVRRAVLSTMRYLLRASGRATPFGLFAGVVAARIGAAPAVRTGTAHRAVATVGGEWLAGVIGRLETDDTLRPHLRVIATHFAVERDGYLVIEHHSSGTGDPPSRARLRATPPVMAALAAARCPIRAADLAAVLAARYPGTSDETIDALLAGLLRHRFLLTTLRAPMTTPDPLAALLDELASLPVAGHAELTGLRAIQAGLARHDTITNQAAARAERTKVTALMANLQPAARPALSIDLRLDWNVMIPEAVAAEAAIAAGALARLARRPVLSSGWAAWHGRFLERYGPGAVVPVLDAVDSATGLGYPAGYLGSAPAEADPLTSRDKILLNLAYTAATRRVDEVELDETMLSELAVVGPGDPVQPSTELAVRIHAASQHSLARGEFTLHVTGVSRAAGATTGRFLSLLDEADRRRMSALYAELPGVHEGALLAQVSTIPLYASAENVARAPQAAGLVIALGEYREPADGMVPVADLAVTADARRLHLVSLSRRRPVHTMLLNGVDLAYHTHPLARFLIEAPVALAAPCTGFDWGAASALPFLPALRYRRTILSPARWVLTASDLPSSSSLWPNWDRALAAWRKRVSLPVRVYLGEGDRCLLLDLEHRSHRALLRTHLERSGKALLSTAPGPRDLGWIGGRVHEIVIPLTRTGPAHDPVRWPGEVTGRDHGHLPGCDGRLSLKLYGPRDRQDSILTRHLQPLLGQLAGQRRWWFLRYADPEDHLRLRFTFPPGNTGLAASRIGAWTQHLRRVGLIADASWDTYYPETARFGGTTVMDSAEEFFAADSAAVLAQLMAAAGRNGPHAQALTAASVVDIAVGLIGDDATAMHWLIEHTRTSSSPPPRALYDQAVALVAAPPSCDSSAASPADAAIAASWRARRGALTGYREALRHTGTICPSELLPDLLHLHHARMAGPDLTAERAILHLSRAAALSWVVRAGRIVRS
jgi:thiopeptide-type bacteriocin biosynthesis protein